ncbi:MAG: hypothetical protein LHV68_08485 [Elusimicrobia bacterium]|nr:hypothetical protein [Candidatus Liberimonas magnetica]
MKIAPSKAVDSILKLCINIVLTLILMNCMIYAECNSCAGMKEGTCPLKCSATQSDKKKALNKASNKPVKTTTKNKKGKVTAAEAQNMKNLKTEKETKVLSVPF